jgi:hypothetical protein
MAETSNAIDYNGATGELIERELTVEEVSNLETIKLEINAVQSEKEAKVTARASALAKLADLGLTAEEIAAL